MEEEREGWRGREVSDMKQKYSDKKEKRIMRMGRCRWDGADNSS